MIQFQQTDFMADCAPAPWCAPYGLPSDLPVFTSQCPMAPAAPGTIPRSQNNTTKFQVCTLFFSVEPLWARVIPRPGTWTVRVFLWSPPETNHKWQNTYLCQINTGTCTSVATLGAGNKAENFVTGTNTHTITGVSVPGAPTSQTAIAVVVTTQRTLGFTLPWKASALIDCPYDLKNAGDADFLRHLSQASGSFGPAIVR